MGKHRSIHHTCRISLGFKVQFIHAELVHRFHPWVDLLNAAATMRRFSQVDVTFLPEYPAPEALKKVPGWGSSPAAYALASKASGPNVGSLAGGWEEAVWSIPTPTRR